MSSRGSLGRVLGILSTLAACAVVLAVLYWLGKTRTGLPAAVISASREPAAKVVKTGAPAGMVHVPSGKFLRGSQSAPSPDARPAHAVQLDQYWIDAHEVTNAEFAQFVAATGYRTTAEELGFSYVFRPTKAKWEKVAGATWQHPGGPSDSLSTKQSFPVVHVSWFDAAAYAQWAHKRLPSGAEWERAARGGFHDMRFPWGADELIGGRRQGNYWRSGVQPNDVTGTPRLLSVGTFAPNGLGLYDVAGNVWEWCHDWYAADEYQRRASDNPRGPRTGTDRVARGGSWVGSGQIAVHHRGHFPPAFSADHLGFRCVKDIE